jgi:hypothetical protein
MESSTGCSAAGHRIAALLAADGWKHAPEEGEDGYTGYVRGRVRLERAFLARSEDGQVYSSAFPRSRPTSQKLATTRA